MVATEGWVETSTVSAIDLAKKFEDAGVAAIIFTDIARDGALTGVNVEATGKLADAVSIPIDFAAAIPGFSLSTGPNDTIDLREPDDSLKTVGHISYLLHTIVAVGVAAGAVLAGRSQGFVSRSLGSIGAVALFAPAGSPRSAIDKIGGETVRILQSRDVAERLRVGVNVEDAHDPASTPDTRTLPLVGRSSVPMMFSMPARHTTSPAAACETSTRFSPSKANSLVRVVRTQRRISLKTQRSWCKWPKRFVKCRVLVRRMKPQHSPKREATGEQQPCSK